MTHDDLNRRIQIRREVMSRPISETCQRIADLEELLRDMHEALTMWASDECCQKWADRMEQLDVYANWEWRD